MDWEVLFVTEFNEWFEAQEEGLVDEFWAHIGLLARFGPNLSRPSVDTLKGSQFKSMKELRVQYKGDPWRIIFTFDPRRRAILLVGGNKRGDKRWYKTNIPIADDRYVRYLQSLQQGEGV